MFAMSDRTEQILIRLEKESWLFPQFCLEKEENGLKLLGRGGFSSVYGMYNSKRPGAHFALKVTGFERHTVSSEEFNRTARIQWILCQESKYIVRIVAVRELELSVDEQGEITGIKDAADEGCEAENVMRLQLTLMEQLAPVLEKDRFGRAVLLREDLKDEAGVIAFALEIGQALCASHGSHCLHRDIKLENIFWDETEQVYKLGDFGIAKYTEDGSADTIVYTDGYGAPEIERRLYDSYGETADIYSFGITLYLLLNDLRFPGSGGYYPKTEVQYSQEFVFPAPEHASEAMAKVIRKMCAYRAADRYQSAAEVMLEMAAVSESTGTELSPEMIEFIDSATETYREEHAEESAGTNAAGASQTRAGRREEQKLMSRYYRAKSAAYLLILTLLFTLLFFGLQPDASVAANWLFCVLPAAVLVEAVFQRMKEFHLLFGVLVIGLTVFSIWTLGLTIPHIVLLLCVLTGLPLLSLAGGLAAFLWIGLTVTGRMQWFCVLGEHHLGWLVLAALIFVVCSYLKMRADWGKNVLVRGETEHDRFLDE
jgi:serine/threonine protein kinase